MSARLYFDMELETIPAGNTSGRVHQRGMTDAWAFGIERLLHDQRTGVPAAGQPRRSILVLVAQLQPCPPAGTCFAPGGGFGKIHYAIR